MGETDVGPGDDPPNLIERQSLCISQPQPGMVIHSGEDGFREEVLRLYSAAESNAAEQLVRLKANLREADCDAFWPLLAEELAAIAGAQYAFVSKRILVDDENSAVEMPPIGEPGACLMGAAFYYNDGRGKKAHLTNWKYHAYSCPCAYMRHDKIFIIPDRLNEFIVNNPNDLAIPGEAYLGIPLFHEGKCFAHFGVMWSQEGAARRVLSWGYLEMLLHSLEDVVLEQLLEGPYFARTAERVTEERPKVIPHEAVSAAQSLRPYARSLSHELRTPMQGVVGMLDVMYATVQEAAEGQDNEQMRKVLDILRGNIEAVQDSSRRAVEAADNVVHAYDMNMGVPETPLIRPDGREEDTSFPLNNSTPVVGNNMTTSRSGEKKRKRSTAAWAAGNPNKIHASAGQKPKDYTLHQETVNGALLTERKTEKEPELAQKDAAADAPTSPALMPSLRPTDLRDVLQYVIIDALKTGGRPDSAVAQETDLGEVIDVRMKNSNGQESIKTIEWIVDDDVPAAILLDEKDLAKMISCVVLNAIKFTDNGSVTLRASLGPEARYIVISVKDTGTGMPEAFLPNLFKPFSREDTSITRQSEGLGLGMFVARGLARKLGGDLLCSRSRMSGPDHGSEFEIRLPLRPGDACSRAGSVLSCPSPSLRSPAEVDRQQADPSQCSEMPPLGIQTSKDRVRRQERSSEPALPSLHLGLSSLPNRASPSRPRVSRGHSVNANSSFDRNLSQRYPRNILVVEDNKINRKLLVSMLRKLGYKNIHEAYDGNDAVNKMKGKLQGQSIDLILMDLWMPLKDGFQAAEEILKMDLPKRPTIVPVSADITEEAMVRAHKVGMVGFLAKPFQIRHLQRLIVEYSLPQSEEDQLPAALVSPPPLVPSATAVH